MMLATSFVAVYQLLGMMSQVRGGSNEEEEIQTQSATSINKKPYLPYYVERRGYGLSESEAIEPELLLYSPKQAMKKVLKKAKLSKGDIKPPKNITSRKIKKLYKNSPDMFTKKLDRASEVQKNLSSVKSINLEMISDLKQKLKNYKKSLKTLEKANKKIDAIIKDDETATKKKLTPKKIANYRQKIADNLHKMRKLAHKQNMSKSKLDAFKSLKKTISSNSKATKKYISKMEAVKKGEPAKEEPKKEEKPAEKKSTSSSYVLFIGVSFAIIVLALGAFMVFKKN